MSKPRYKVFMEELPKNKNVVMTSAIKAGYTESYARARGKTIVRNAIKKSAQEVLDRVRGEAVIQKTEIKKLMSEIVGISDQTLMERLRFIATQDKDLNSALKVIVPLVKELGVILTADDDSQKRITPVLNITVKKNDENVNDTGILDGQVIEDGSTKP